MRCPSASLTACPPESRRTLTTAGSSAAVQRPQASHSCTPVADAHERQQQRRESNGLSNGQHMLCDALVTKRLRPRLALSQAGGSQLEAASDRRFSDFLKHRELESR
jgi:hypothetical protein